MTGADSAVRRRFRGWNIAVLLLLAVFAFGVVPRLHLETNILALLPANKTDPGIDRALARFTAQIGSQVVFLIGDQNFARARAGAKNLAQTLQASNQFDKVRWKVDAGWLQKATAAYAPYRSGLLSTRTRKWLKNGNDAAVLGQARRALYTPAAFMRRSRPAEDPLNLFGAFLTQTTPAMAGKLSLRNDVLAVFDHGIHYVLVNAKLRGKAFSAADGARVAPVLDTAMARARADGLKVVASGVVLHAIAAAEESKTQLIRFGIVQTLGLLALLWWAFRSWRVPALAAATLGMGFVAALVACHYAFGRVHVLTLVFGCNLAGIAIDYCLYFCADQFRSPGHWRPADGLSSVGGAITVGMIISVLSYAVLATTPFPGLRQMALFCGAGLAVAWACVLLWYPRVLKPAPLAAARRNAVNFARADAWLTRGFSTVPSVLWWAFAGVLVVGVVTGLARLHFVDDVRVLQDAPPQLVRQDKMVGQLLGGTDRRFFLVRGANAEAVLERSQALDARLHKAEQAGTVGNFTSVTQALPSARRQAENRRLLAAHVYDGRNGLLARFMHEMGFSDAAITQRLAEFQAQGAPLTVAKWLPSAAADPYRHLWLGKIDSNTSAAVTTLSKVHDAAALADVATGLPGVKRIDPVADISTVLGAYRVRIMWLAALACGLSVLVLALYFHARRDWWLALTPAFAAVMTMAAFGLLGISANLFNLVALLLVLGLSVDYAIFTQRGRAQRHSTLLSVSLAAAATLLAFGLLSLSTTPFVRSLGLTVLVGVLIAYLLCLVLGRIEVRQWKA